MNSMPDLLSSLLLIAARAGPLCMFVPAGGDVLGVMSRLFLCGALVVTCYSVIPEPSLQVTPLAYIREFGLGMLLAIPALVFFGSAAALAEIVDILRGQMMANLYDPFVERTSVFSKMHAEFVNVLFVASGGLLELARNLVSSFESVPLSAAPGLSQCGELGLRLGAGLLSQTLAPLGALMVLMLAAEICSVLISKFIPGFRLGQDSYTVRTIVAGLWYVAALRSEIFLTFLSPIYARKVVEALAGG
ncbi:MAG: flagellar biosynthetic protein FliR [Oligoflexia bacterium]|nr:flagellar biosynthetic protein FliR [Oligoflexia bacterium]